MAPRGVPGLLFGSILEAIGGTFGTLELFWAVFLQVRFSVEIRMSFVVKSGVTVAGRAVPAFRRK